MAARAKLMGMTQLNQSDISDAKPRRPNFFSGVFLGFLLLVFLAAFGYASYLFFQTARNIVLNAPQMSANPVIATDAPAGPGYLDNEDNASQGQIETGDAGSSS